MAEREHFIQFYPKFVQVERKTKKFLTHTQREKFEKSEKFENLGPTPRSKVSHRIHGMHRIFSVIICVNLCAKYSLAAISAAPNGACGMVGAVAQGFR